MLEFSEGDIGKGFFEALIYNWKSLLNGFLEEEKTEAVKGINECNVG